MKKFKSFEKSYNAGRTQLVWDTIPADLNTPVTAYLKLCGHDPYGFLLESVEGGNTLGRYSIIGLEPDLILTNEKPETIRKALESCHIDNTPDHLPPMAVSGLFGYMGYDMIRHIEDIPDNNPDDLGIPQSILMRPKILVIFDNVQSKIYLLTPIYKTSKTHKEKAQDIFKAAEQRIKTVRAKLDAAIDPKLLKAKTNLAKPPKIRSNVSQDDYKKAVTKTVDYIHKGDIFQAVLGQRFSCEFDLPSFEFYRHLRQMNPSPFMFHLAFDGFSIVGSSPEILVRVRNKTVTIRPIAGTRPRGKNAEEDQAYIDDLLADKKELAEHLMLLDLGRNDVGRVSKFGSVQVTEQNKIELYSHVMHIVSNVEGQLRNDQHILDALFAGFPAGTVSGAPKIRAMEIIDELEVSKRSYYGGAVGYLSGNDDMDTCIALRTGLIKDNKLYVQAGAGIVADSNPQNEHQECLNKSQALFAAAFAALEYARSQP